MRDEEGDLRQYDVVINHEEQYSIWLKGKEIPAGWRAVGKGGLKADCLAYVEEVWTDMRPLSLRKHMEAYEAQQRAAKISADAGGVSGPADQAAPVDTSIVDTSIMAGKLLAAAAAQPSSRT